MSELSKTFFGLPVIVVPGWPDNLYVSRRVYEFLDGIYKPPSDQILSLVGQDRVSTRQVLVPATDTRPARPRHAPVTTRIARHTRQD